MLHWKLTQRNKSFLKQEVINLNSFVFFLKDGFSYVAVTQFSNCAQCTHVLEEVALERNNSIPVMPNVLGNKN